MSRTSARSAARTASPPKLSRASVVFRGFAKRPLLGSPWFLLRTKVTNTTGNENSGPFIQPLVCVRECRYRCRREHVWVQVGKYSWGCIFLQVHLGKYSWGCIFLQPPFFSHTKWQPKITDYRDTATLRCPETLFISHENANFFSVFRVVQSEAKTPKIMGCCRANFAFLHALKRDWHFSWKMIIRMSDQNVTFRSPGSLFFNHQ